MRYISSKSLNCLKYSLLSALWVLQIFVVQSLVGQNIQLTFSSSPPKCNGYTDGTVTVTATGGVAPYAYLWNNGQAGQTNFGVGAGTVSVTVTGQNGLTATGTTTITQPTQIVAAINPTGIHCLTGGGTLNGSATGGTAPYTYVWGNGATTASLPITSTGAYLLTVTDANGCSDLENYFVRPPLDVSVEVQNIPCFMFCDGVAWANVTGGIPPYSYLWNNGATSSQIFELMPGWYAVMVTDAAGCSVIDSAYIYEPPAITIDFSAVIPACGGNTGSVTAQASGGTPPFTYLWSYNNVVGPTLSNVPSGTYYVQVTDANGCQKSMPVSISAGTGLNVTLSILKASCQGVDDGTVTALVSPTSGTYSYQWNIQNVNTASLNGIASGTSVCVTVTDVNTGCQGTACGIVGTHAVINLQVTDTEVSCAADLTGIATALASNGEVPYTYTWTYPNSTTSNDATITGLGAGAYAVLATDNRGCTAVGVADIGVVSTLDAAYELSLVECTGSAVQVRFSDKSVDSGSNIVAWSWNIVWGSGSVQSTEQNPLVTLPANETGTAQLTVTSASGCTNFTSAPFSVDALPNVNISVNSPAFTCDGSPVRIEVTGDPSYTYTWSPLAGLTFDPGPQKVIANPAQTQIYTLIAGNGSCADTVQVEVIRQTPLALSLATHEVFTCATTATLTATVNVDAVVEWFDGSGASVATGTTVTVPASAVPTKYVVVATDALGCVQKDSITVTGKEVSIALNVPAEVFNCNNDTISIHVVGAPANTYTWSPTTGLIFPNPNSPDIIANPAITTDYQLIATNGFCSDTARVKVIRVTPIELAVENTTVNACAANATLEATINAASNAEVRWQPTNLTGMSITVPATSTPTTYTVTARDPIYGCTQTATATVVGRAAEVSVTANTPTSICVGQPVLLSATNGISTDILTYQWSATPALTISPDNAANVTITGAVGQYVVTLVATNQYGCTHTEQVPVTFQASGSLAGNINIKNCGGLSVDFQNLSAFPGTWNFGDNQTSTQNNVTHTYAGIGSYTATFTPTGAADCIAPFDTIVQVQMASVVLAAITSNLDSCTQQAVYSFAAQPNTGNYTWQWTAPNNQTSAEANPTFTFTQAGPVNVQLTVTDAQGCVGTATLPLEVNLVNEQIANNMTFCPGSSVQLNPDFNPNYTYLWSASPNDPTLDPTSPNPTVTPTATTTYTLQVSNGNCTAQYTAEVKLQETTVLDLGPNQRVCDDTPVILSVQNPTPGSNYQWSQSLTFNTILAEGSSVQIIPEPNGVYYVRAEGGVCPAFGTVRVNNAKVLVDALPKDQNLCLGQSTTLTITNLHPDDILEFIWTPNLGGVVNPTVTPDSTTTYTAVVTNQFNCSDTVAFNVSVVELASTAIVVGKDTICPGQAATLLATATGTGIIFTYSWTPAGSLNDPNIANPIARPDVETEYTVTITADGLCPQTASVKIFFQGDQCLEPYIFVPKAFTPNGDESNDHFIVRGVNIKELYMVVWDRWGEKVYETEDTQALGWDGTYQGASLTPDAYAWYVKATCGNGAVYEKKGNVTLLK